MTTGGFLSPKLYVPRNIWYQKTAVRLPAIDAKIHACQTLSQTLDRMVAQSKSGKLTLLVELGGRVEKGEKDRAMLLHELAALENLTQELWVKLSKKMSFIHRPNKNQSVGSGSANGGTLMLGLQQQGYRPSHLYQNQALYNPSTQTHRHGDQNQSDEHGPSSASDPYSWLGSEEMWASTLQSGGLTAGSISSGSVSSGTLTGSSMVTSPVSEKGSGNNNNTSHKRVTSGGAASDLKSQWKSFSKSVQKSIATDKIEDTTSYTEALIQLFQSSYILESMLKHFEALPPHQTHFKILGRLQRISDFYNLVVCAFVIRDLGELMSKYVKRMGAAVAE
ncbi:hypothetical protein BCR41DRAFT_376112 [Lobosporangium transversale]|uniref:Uncharacterized protein n=1 Tax=Lobosporangium transversale TaxID=64571 RepID=A0A1Y2G0A1_9FUNG|nr:hypothetical protein BCR41DRAFT_376112 [Lobosporangium transversale]ORY90053.1 hypothetical protein BCR41DRAFT_376112 [Lobosporangium transversale]|eukprot:XP_021875089.1 hypothetical protein BCR41DRAFT_376112 [Lobosporangium transversale]